MKLSWVMLLASEMGNGTPSSGSAPTSAAAWSCEEDAERWGYSKNKGTDNMGPEGKSWHDSTDRTGIEWGFDRTEMPVKASAEMQSRLETTCFA
jgi:hypothetical protein